MYGLSQCDGLKWRRRVAGLDDKKVDGQLQVGFQFVLDAGALHDRYSGIAFDQKIDITAPRLIIQPRAIK